MTVVQIPAIAIPNLLYEYADAIDGGDFAKAAGLFKHGWILSQGRRVRGNDAIIALWRSWVRVHPDGTPRTRHLVTNPVINLADDETTASCRSQWTILQATDTLPLQPIASGRYEDRMAVIAGEWRFVERCYVAPDLVGDMSSHLSRPISEDT